MTYFPSGQLRAILSFNRGVFQEFLHASGIRHSRRGRRKIVRVDLENSSGFGEAKILSGRVKISVGSGFVGSVVEGCEVARVR